MKNKKKNRTLLLVFSILIVLAVVVIIIFYLIIWHNRESNSIKEKDKVQSILNPEEPFLILGNDLQIKIYLIQMRHVLQLPNQLTL